MVAGDIGCLYSATTRSNIDFIVMYCVTLVWRHEIYPPIGSSPASDSASSIGDTTSDRSDTEACVQ